MTTWATAKSFFEVDGALRDLYAFGTTLSDWQRFRDWLPSASFPSSFTADSEPATLPERVDDIFELAAQKAITLTLHAGFGSVNCHFFSTKQIELDLRPEDVQSDEQFQQLLRLVEELAAAIGKPITLTQENWPEARLLTYDPVTHQHEEFAYEGL